MPTCLPARTLAGALLALGLAGCGGNVQIVGEASPLDEGPPPAPDTTATTDPPMTTTTAPTQPGDPPPDLPLLPDFENAMVVNVSQQFSAFGWDDGEDESNPSLTGDLLQLFFTSDREVDGDDNGDDVWVAIRQRPNEPFGEPVRVDRASTDGFDTSPSVSDDGLTLWVGQRPDGDDDDVDIFRFTRSDTQSLEWSERVAETSLNSEYQDIPRPPGHNGLIMPLASQRANQGAPYLTYLATRPSLGEPFGEPAPVDLWEGVTPPTNREIVDASLSNNGLILFFNWEDEDGRGQLYMSWRAGLDERFSAPQPLQNLNDVEADDKDPWIAPDGSKLYFTSDRDSDSGNYDLFEVPIVWRPQATADGGGGVAGE